MEYIEYNAETDTIAVILETEDGIESVELSTVERDEVQS